jgi:hypothetical protein
MSTALIAVAVPAPSYARTGLETAAFVSDYCSTIANTKALKGIDPTVYVVPADVKSWYCFGAFETIIQEVGYTKPVIGAEMSRDCLYDEMPDIYELVSAFVSHIRAHPDAGTHMFRPVALAFVHSRYPCKKGH